MANYRIKNVSPKMVTLSLQGGEKNTSLILTPRETSRALTLNEFNSPQVQSAIKTRDVVNVTR